MKEYRKKYWPLGVWLLALIVCFGGAGIAGAAAGLSEEKVGLLMMLALLAALNGLFLLIWAGEYVYWINGGPSFEQAEAAGREARREYAWKHLRAMLTGSAAALVLLTAAYFLNWPELTYMLSVAGCVVAAALSTIGIKWTDKGKEE